MNPAEMKTALIAEARTLGFEVCRVASAEKPPHAEEFRKWLGEEKHGDMAWLARNADRRTDPNLVLPGVRSIIVLGMNYWQREPNQKSEIRNPKFPSGRIARYAWGDDYHDIIEPRLWQLDAWLQKHGGAQRQYVDTGPVLERDFAARAGAGRR